MMEFDHVLFCSGGRNAALLQFFDSSTVEYFVDERQAAFTGLGLAKRGQRVAVVVTSGTAVLECLPALAEAYYSNTPLVLISGDRPERLEASGAPQSFPQAKVVAALNVTQFDINLEHFVNLSTPVECTHINVRIEQETLPRAIQDRSEASLLMVCHGAEVSSDWIESLQIPCFVEASYGHFVAGEHIIRTNRELKRFCLKQKGLEVFRIGHTPFNAIWRDVHKYASRVVASDPRGLPGLDGVELLPLEELTSRVQDRSFEWIHGHTPDPLKSSEQSFYRKVLDLIPQSALLYLGNSLVIRHAQDAWSKSFAGIEVSRGLNGIDGQIATAVGLAKARPEQPVVAILGDQTFLYDWSSLGRMPSNLQIVIMNNGGGQIFSFAGYPDDMVLKHDQSMLAHAKFFGLSYEAFENEAEIGLDAQIIELFPDHLQTKAEWDR